MLDTDNLAPDSPIPPLKRGSGGFAGRHRLENRFHDDVQLLEHLQIGKSQHPQPLLFEIGAAHFILSSLRGFKVMSPVYFNDQGHCGCVEINNIVADGLLPLELYPKQLLATQAPPQALLGVGHCRAQTAGGLLQARVVLEHDYKIPPGPPFVKGGNSRTPLSVQQR